MSKQFNQIIMAAVLFCGVLLSCPAAQASTAPHKSDFEQGINCFQKHLYVQAASYFRNHISNNSKNNAQAFYYLANCHYQMNQMADAERYYRACFDYRPDATQVTYCKQALQQIAMRKLSSSKS